MPNIPDKMRKYFEGEQVYGIEKPTGNSIYSDQGLASLENIKSKVKGMERIEGRDTNVPMEQQAGQFLDEIGLSDKIGMDPQEKGASYAEQVDTRAAGIAPKPKAKAGPDLSSAYPYRNESKAAKDWIESRVGKSTEQLVGEYTIDVRPDKGGYKIFVDGEDTGKGVNSERATRDLAEQWANTFRSRGMDVFLPWKK